VLRPLLEAILVVGVIVEIGVSVAHRLQSKQRFNEFLFSLAFQIGFFILSGIQYLVPEIEGIAPGAAQLLIVSRGILLLIPSLSRSSRLSGFVTDIVSHPAQTVALSFLLAILVGTWLLMLPFTAADGSGLRLVDALFTATSAVCVTGLIVVDTATAYTMWGQLTIMVLIQIGGLGIMVLALFTFTMRRQAVSVESKVLLSYMISEKRMTELSGALRRIVLITLGVETAGAALLFVFLGPVSESVGHRALLATFHAISAFCNAGFALFTTSLEQFHQHLGINLVVIVLIIAGGISFGVLTNVFQYLRDAAAKRFRSAETRITPLSVNTRAVLLGTAIMLSAAFFLFYALEHARSLASYRTGHQYLAAFFQSVTLRTAGFNTIPINQLATGTYVMMMVFMFIGGASGSTAGGIKVNNAAVIAAYVGATRRGRNQTLIFGHAVSDRQTATAFTVLLVGLLSVIGGTFLLTLTEAASLTQIMFESVSAFATVGLSTGITGDLSWMGRVIITILMFIGRVGPLTLLAASTGPSKTLRVEYPSADMAIG
jgi:trk system potassium uptake protein TrkH